MLQGARPHPSVSGVVSIKPEPSSLSTGGGLRVSKPEPEWSGMTVKQKPDLPPLLVGYKVKAEPGDPEDEPGLPPLLAGYKVEAESGNLEDEPGLLRALCES